MRKLQKNMFLAVFLLTDLIKWLYLFTDEELTARRRAMQSKLAYYLKIEGLSQRGLARKTEVSEAYISMLCRNRRRPRLDLALRISDVIRRPVREIFP